jgi:hypothetical protein
VTVLTIEKIGRKRIQIMGFLMEALFCESFADVLEGCVLMM